VLADQPRQGNKAAPSYLEDPQTLTEIEVAMSTVSFGPPERPRRTATEKAIRFTVACALLALAAYLIYGTGLVKATPRNVAIAAGVSAASDLAQSDSDDDLLVHAVSSEPTPEFAVMVAEEYRRLLDRLGDDVQRKVAILRMEGLDTDAIAEQLGCATPHCRAATGAHPPHLGRRNRREACHNFGPKRHVLLIGPRTEDHGPWTSVSALILCCLCFLLFKACLHRAGRALRFHQRA
jgi:hypothetical protein